MEKFREVGTPRPSDGVHILYTPDERTQYMDRLARFQARNALLCPVSRVFAPNEPRVKRFTSWDEAEADTAQAKIQLAQWLKKSQRRISE
jgi:hypothetical protein